MSTIGNQLNILRDTQMVQRRQLESLFPYIEWERMPFSSYRDFFALAGIIKDCGEVWTNAYGRSNEEPDGQRNFLQDYSGKGRDIELFNFGYSKQSGYNGYVQDFKGVQYKEGDHITIIEQTDSVLEFNNSNNTFWNLGFSKATWVNKEFKVFVEADNDVRITYINSTDTISSKTLSQGLNTVAALSDDLYESSSVIYIGVHGGRCRLTQIGEYEGAIVGDGVDDYGQCVKDFALPTDYTVVAMRETFPDRYAESQTLISKVYDNERGAFIFDYVTLGKQAQAVSYGNWSGTQEFTKLFSYMTKNNFNGLSITPGDATDIERNKLRLFILHNSAQNYTPAALYSFGIFNRSLTEDELRIVENCMYAEWICMTGKLDDIEYYDILDARFRSNDEDPEKRNKWVGRLGKLHIDLHNYAYSGMSGWNGINSDFTKWEERSVGFGKIIDRYHAQITKTSDQVALQTNSIEKDIVLKTRITGLDAAKKVSKLNLYIIIYNDVDDSSSWKEIGFQIHNDGVYNVTISTANNATKWMIYLAGGFNDVTIDPINIELIPDYGGALVSDGVDDYGISQETIDEPINGIVCHVDQLSLDTNRYVYDSGTVNESWLRIFLTYDTDSIPKIGNPMLNLDKFGIIGWSRNVTDASNAKLNISAYFNDANKEGTYGNYALYQLRLIKSQPTDTQLEAIKWQCRKEHDDYLIHMGWKDETPAWYGIEWDVTDSSPDVKRIGNMQMHRDLPVHSQMKGCLLNDDGAVTKYLNETDWTSETRDGSQGQVMVELPKDSYWRFETDGNIRRVKFSTTRLPGFKRTPQGYISAYEATVQRSANKLCSVVNTDADYRGGNNNSAYDGTYRSFLGLPASAIDRPTFRTYARNRKSGSTAWNCMVYDFQKLLYWLFVTEYATLNSQKAVNTEKDENGFAQGGLGNGVTTWDWTSWTNHNGNHAIIPCGASDSLGNRSGEVSYDITLSDSSTRNFKVARYRGVENPFGHLWAWTDGLNFRISANTSAGGDGLSRIFTCSDPAKFSDSGYDGYKEVGNASRGEGYMKSIVFGEDGDIEPTATGGSQSTYFCDYWYTSIPSSGESLRGLLLGGTVYCGSYAGFVYSHSDVVPSYSHAYVGSRLCFITEDETEA